MSRDELEIADAGDRDATWHTRGGGDGRRGTFIRTHMNNVRYLIILYTLMCSSSLPSSFPTQ